MTNKEECSYAVLSSIDDGLSIAEAVDQIYEHHIGPLEEEVEYLRTENAKLRKIK